MVENYMKRILTLLLVMSFIPELSRTKGEPAIFNDMTI